MARLSVLLLSAACLAQVLAADAPLPPPADRTVYAANRKCYAFLDARGKKTTVFEVRQGAPAVRSWEAPGWYRVAELADDCEHFVVGFDGINLLPLDYRKDQAMLSFYRRGKLLKTVRLNELIADYSKLGRTASHYYWGRYLGFDQRQRFVVETVEGRRIAFDPRTGERARD